MSTTARQRQEDGRSSSTGQCYLTALSKVLEPAQASQASFWQAFPFSPMPSAQLKTLEYMLVSGIAFSSDALGHCCHATAIHSQKTFRLNAHLHLGAFKSHSNKRQIPFLLFLLPFLLSRSHIKISPRGTVLSGFGVLFPHECG